jgi:flagellin
MLEEIDRISSTTQFNGQNLLDGSLSHTAAADNKSVHAMQTSMSVEAGEYSFTLTEAAEQAGRSDPLTVTEPPVGKSVLINDAEIKNDGSGDFKEKVKKACDTMNLDYDPDSGKVMSKAFGAKVSLSVQNDGQEKKTVYGKDSVIRLTTVNEGAGFKAGATYKADGNDITIVDNNGFEMNIQIKGEDASKTAGKEIKVNVFEAGYLMDQVGSNEGQFLGINIAKTDCCSLGIKNFDGTNNVNCCTRTGAGNAITIFDEAIRRLSNTRSQLGAYENRLDAVVRNLGVSTENLTNAMSRIGDTDIAEEMSNYTSLDVQNQAATSMLAQSNNRTKEVLNLLQA